MIPNEPHMLLSFINMKLRDEYSSLEELCDDLGLEIVEIVDKLDAIGYGYDRKNNRFL